MLCTMYRVSLALRKHMQLSLIKKNSPYRNYDYLAVTCTVTSPLETVAEVTLCRQERNHWISTRTHNLQIGNQTLPNELCRRLVGSVCSLRAEPGASVNPLKYVRPAAAIFRTGHSNNYWLASLFNIPLGLFWENSKGVISTISSSAELK